MDYLSCSNLINSIGLLFDIAGAVLLVIYGLPAEVSKDGSVAIGYQQKDPEQIKKWGKYNLWSKVGLLSILIGFAFQLLSNFLAN